MAAAATALLLMLGATGHEPAPVAPHHDAAATARPAVPAAEVALRQDMRELWEEHVVWTRLAIVHFAAGSPGLPATEARLLRNQTDIGRAVGRVYEAAAGRRLTALLREHIVIAVDVLIAAKAATPPRSPPPSDGGSPNGTHRGFLAAANPAWRRGGEMRAIRSGRHLGFTTPEAVAQLTGDYAGSARAFDRVEAQAREMADMLSAGIVDQFPARFR